MLEKNFKSIKISSEYITLGQLLKFANVISNGGEAKNFILNNKILVNNEATIQRGKKLRPNDKIIINDELFFEIK